MKFLNPSILVLIAMADAYAMATEYLKFPRDLAIRERVLLFEGYVGHEGHGHVASTYTDDAEMTNGCAIVLSECEAPYTPLMFADSWVREFNYGGRRKGYSQSSKRGSGGFQQLLETTPDGIRFLERVLPVSDKNGAAMRSAVLGVLRTVKEVLEVATLQASITHNTPSGRFSSRAVALMAHYALYESGPLRDVGTYCLDNLPREDVREYGYVFRQRWNGNPVVGSKLFPVSITTVWAAATLVMYESSLMEMLRKCIEWGGDTDSVAAIAWGIASARFQDESLPPWMERDLECGNPRTGAPRLRALGTKLMDKFHTPA